MVFFENIRIGNSIKIHIEVKRQGVKDTFIISEQENTAGEIEEIKGRLKETQIFKAAGPSDKHRITNHIIATVNDFRRQHSEN